MLTPSPSDFKRGAMTQEKLPSDARPYHHGDLQRAILNAAFDVLSESQSTEFSLRELARRAGVSHNAPYKHFADKRELLAAVSAVGFERLEGDMQRAQVDLLDPRARLKASMRAYVENGAMNPALYRLMFGGYLTEGGDRRPAVERAAGWKMRAIIVATITDGAFGEPLADTTGNIPYIDGAILVLWSQIHGLTSLIIDGLVGPASSLPDLTDHALEAIIRGLSAGNFALPPEAWVGPKAQTA
jgi:AcrR family transcriptional regulator